MISFGIKRGILVILFMTLLAGCVTLKLNETQSILGEIAARRLAYTMAKAHPEIIDTGILICNGILLSDGENTSKLANSALISLMDYVGEDPMLKADLAIILKAVNINMPEKLPTPTLLKSIASAFKSGLEVAKGAMP